MSVPGRPLVPPAPEVRLLVQAIGEQATLRLVEAFGGTRVYVAARPGEESQVATAVGLEAAAALGATELGGERVRVPLARAWRVQLLHALGATNPEIVRRVGMDRSTVYRIINAKRDTKQLYLQFE